MTELKNSFREEAEREALGGEVRPEPGSRLIVARRSGKLLGPDAAPLVRSAAPAKPEVRFLRVGDHVRALGLVYRVRKVTNKDIVMRPVKEEP